MPEPVTGLDQQMRAVLLRLELLSHGSTSAWNSSGGQSGEPDDRNVTQVMRVRFDTYPHLHYRDLYDRQRGDAGRLAVIAEATELVDSWGRRSKPADDEKTESFEDILLADGDGWEVAAVAQHFNVAPAFVRRIRERNGRSTEDGREVAAVPGDQALRARAMREKGLTTRQIALNLGVHQTQVMRWIRSAA